MTSANSRCEYDWVRQAMDKASNFEELVGVAKLILSRLRASFPDQLITMICGPITTGGRGSLDLNLEFLPLPSEWHPKMA